MESVSEIQLSKDGVTEFLNLEGVRESTPWNRFRQPILPAGRNGQPIPTRFLTLRDCSIIPAKAHLGNYLFK